MASAAGVHRFRAHRYAMPRNDIQLMTSELLDIIDQYDMQAAWAVRAQLDLLLDIAGA